MAGNLISDSGIARIQSTIRTVDGLSQSPTAGQYRQGLDPDGGWFLARITGWTATIANARWKYAWQEVLLDADADLPITARSGTTTVNYAINLIEVNNITHHTGTQGNSVNQLPPYPVNFQLLPVGGGTGGVVANQVVVMMYVVTDGSRQARPVFQYQNADFGTCT